MKNIFVRTVATHFLLITNTFPVQKQSLMYIRTVECSPTKERTTMRTDLSLQDMASKVKQEHYQKHDYLADTRSLQLVTTDRDSEATRIMIKDIGDYSMNNHCWGQLQDYTKIPAVYFKRLREDHPGLLRDNVNHLMEHEPPKTRLVRTLDGVARAFLSNSYRMDMDNWDIVNAVLPILSRVEGLDVKSCSVTETRMYIKALFPKLRQDVKVGEPVQGGIVISNSEVGEGAVKVEPFMFQLICLNGMVRGVSMRKFHSGAKIQGDDEAREIFSDKTRRLTNEALKSQIADMVVAATDEAKFAQSVEGLRRAASDETRIEADPVKAVEVVREQLHMTQDEGSAMLRHLIEGGDLTQYGVAQAVTRTASDCDSYDRATELERAGGSVIDLPKQEWAVIQQAA